MLKNKRLFNKEAHDLNRGLLLFFYLPRYFLNRRNHCFPGELLLVDLHLFNKVVFLAGSVEIVNGIGNGFR